MGVGNLLTGTQVAGASMYSLIKHCGGCGKPFTNARRRNLEARLKYFAVSGALTVACLLCQKCAARMMRNSGLLLARPRKASA